MRKNPDLSPDLAGLSPDLAGLSPDLAGASGRRSRRAMLRDVQPRAPDQDDTRVEVILRGLVESPNPAEPEDGPRPGVSLGLAVLSIVASVPLSLLPRPWRERLDPDGRLPFAVGTAVSSALGLILALGSFGHAYLTGAGPLVEHLPPSLFLLLLLVACLDNSVRLVNAVTLWTPLGSLPLWLIERAFALMRRYFGGPGTRAAHSPLPRARALRRWPRGRGR